MENTRHLSPVRLILAIFMLGAFLYGAFFGLNKIKETVVQTEIKPWFASYVDVTATPRFQFEQVDTQIQNNLVLSFIVSSKNNACTPTWGGTYTLEEARETLDVDRRIARLRQRGGNVAISFGGQLNDELSVNCTDSVKLLSAYQEVIDRYSVDTIDLDIEGAAQTNIEAIVRRSEVIAKLQQSYRTQNKNLAVWLTLPVAPTGLTENGTNTVKEMLAHGVDLAGVNVMTMDYGASKDKSQSMIDASKSALIETQRQLGILYRQAGINLSDASLWAKIGATPMIGQNDFSDEIFTLDDAQKLNTFATEKHISRVSMWSANRDLECGENYVNLSVVSDSCSGVAQTKFAYVTALSVGFTGEISRSATLVTTPNPETKQLPDNPATSPYQIWSEKGTYLEGTKVVWHQNVYQAKWWTQGDLPDNPVLQTWQTPWQLVGPVLPGEKPIPLPTLAPGTYPEWSGSTVYEEGKRVLFNGVPYQAKWWNQGESPAASTSNPDSSPWKLLAVEESKTSL